MVESSREATEDHRFSRRAACAQMCGAHRRKARNRCEFSERSAPPRSVSAEAVIGRLLRYLRYAARPSRTESGEKKWNEPLMFPRPCLSPKAIRSWCWHFFFFGFSTVKNSRSCAKYCSLLSVRNENVANDDVSPVLPLQVFQGNFDNDTHRKNVIEPPIYARLIRILPWSWYGRITLRVEILGCTEEEWSPFLHRFFCFSFVFFCFLFFAMSLLPPPLSFDVLEHRTQYFNNKLCNL